MRARTSDVGHRLAALAALVLLIVAPPARAAESDAPTAREVGREAIDTSKHRIELGLGYGITMTFANHVSYDERRQFVLVSPRLAFFATSLDVEPPFRGAFEVMAAVDVLSQFAPNGRYGVGVGPLFRYDFWTGSPVVPFLEFGCGLVAHDFGHPEQGGHFGFELQGGIGAQVFVEEAVALLIEYRFHHISSAFIYKPNNGINSSLFTIGAAIFF
jgi:hypothetical protein